MDQTFINQLDRDTGKPNRGQQTPSSHLLPSNSHSKNLNGIIIAKSCSLQSRQKVANIPQKCDTSKAQQYKEHKQSNKSNTHLQRTKISEPNKGHKRVISFLTLQEMLSYIFLSLNYI